MIVDFFFHYDLSYWYLKDLKSACELLMEEVIKFLTCEKKDSKKKIIIRDFPYSP